MKTFLSGISGFVGRHLLRRLRAEGHELVALVRSSTAAEAEMREGTCPRRGNLSDHQARVPGRRSGGSSTMKSTRPALLLSLACATPGPALAEPIEVAVEVSGLRAAKGRVLLAFHDDRWAFPSRWERAVASTSVAAQEGTVTATLRLPRPGRFALIVVHDEDGDGRMKKSALGLPREGYATSRNASELEFPFFEPALRDWTLGTRMDVRVLYP